ncbi:tachylectin-related carbohydrate-binding protein [Saccharothrix sp. NRRL B-16314]|uniref:tachylectin-related carbohydrate-binding protein n=1 Tax=Saccharothrix sp. NRRL B-16314 TaxID=1463825 RepID=UPI00052774E6|nr:tachylectin-related carbohydrate-binding protein [Saccharothrix sp. NRRL B-16314]
MGSPKVLDTGWNQYNLIVATDDGVLYARTPNGDLFRFRWNPASDRFTQYRERVGWGWAIYNRVFSPGGDILYGTRTDTQQLVWFRYGEDTATWAGGTAIGSGWSDELDVVADTNSCRLTGYPVPTRPSVPQRSDAATTPVQGTDGLVTFFYVNSAGGLTAGKQRYAGDYEIIEYDVIADYHQFTGAPGVGVREDGRLETLANSHDDAAYRGRVQSTANGSWGPITGVTTHQGWMLSDPVVVSEADKTLTVYAVDDGGALWRRTQVAPNSAYMPWRKIGGTGLTTDFTLVRNGTALDVVARSGDGSLRTARYAGGTLGTWRAIGTDTTGKPAAVAHANGDLQVFVRATDGTVRTQRESGGVFPGAWQTIGNIIAAGSPAAVLRAGGLVELAVRGTDGLVHQSSQVAPAGGFGPWTVHYFEDAATDPTGLLLTSGSPIFTWRSTDGSIRTVFIAAAGTSRTAAAFVGQEARR